MMPLHLNSNRLADALTKVLVLCSLKLTLGNPFLLRLQASRNHVPTIANIIMTREEKGRSQRDRKSRSIQSRLTPAFFSPRHGSSSTSSPYFSRPPANTYGPGHERRMSSNDATEIDAPTNGVSTLNLYTERRSKLDRPPPSLTSSPSSRRSNLLAQVAAETKAVLPNVLKLTPNAPPKGELYEISDRFRLDYKYNPRFPPTKIRVLNADTIDAALSLPSQSAPTASTPSSKPVLMLNMANAYHAGGGWEQGALAQEEALCYRSSLSFTLKLRFYPIPGFGGIYSPTVVVIRESMAQGHNLLDLTRPEDLPVVSCVSVAAIREPDIVHDAAGRERYRRSRDRDTMKEKMRVLLRIAALTRHRRLVLGALGCGAFGNPNVEVAQCWKEVFEEREFGGGWWETVVFAVMEEGGQTDGDGNFGVFWRALDRVEV